MIATTACGKDEAPAQSESVKEIKINPIEVETIEVERIETETILFEDVSTYWD